MHVYSQVLGASRKRLHSDASRVPASIQKTCVCPITAPILPTLLLPSSPQAGPLSHVCVPFNKTTGKPSNYGFVEFLHRESVPYSIALMNGLRLCGRFLKVRPVGGKALSSTLPAPQNPPTPLDFELQADNVAMETEQTGTNSSEVAHNPFLAALPRGRKQSLTSSTAKASSSSSALNPFILALAQNVKLLNQAPAEGSLLSSPPPSSSCSIPGLFDSPPATEHAVSSLFPPAPPGLLPPLPPPGLPPPLPPPLFGSRELGSFTSSSPPFPPYPPPPLFPHSSSLQDNTPPQLLLRPPPPLSASHDNTLGGANCDGGFALDLPPNISSHSPVHFPPLMSDSYLSPPLLENGDAPPLPPPPFLSPHSSAVSPNFGFCTPPPTPSSSHPHQLHLSRLHAQDYPPWLKEEVKSRISRYHSSKLCE